MFFSSSPQAAPKVIQKDIRSARRALSPPYCPELFFYVLSIINGDGKKPSDANSAIMEAQ